eukprot:TRINITY_DN10978_c0_g2_i1.p1 TRINITY_DN10978_c0_g2~~TRINITY_DN10978_c0_g2_i1.p1  ORF type:complete len:236 (-),score=28.91 TRINITY_DN10978_c0_g2_i1:52-711(-)
MDSDDDLKLPADTLAVLNQFLAENAERQQKEEADAKSTAFIDQFEEDWNFSQFWYTRDTANRIATECIAQSNGGKIACLSTPSIFRALKALEPKEEYYVFEYDKRFSCYGDRFIFYDYKAPHNFPSDFSHAFDVIVLDPPFLSEECFSKSSETVMSLLKKGGKVIIMTGSVMEPLILRIFKELDVHLCNFRPKHERALQNDFSCFANFESPRLSEREEG